jgi:hypothetical protein
MYVHTPLVLNKVFLHKINVYYYNNYVAKQYSARIDLVVELHFARHIRAAI